ncbi:MAG TPA: hypothetical protein VGB70_12310 [Allosphingosinicella sp.]|jgi:hypothetical protein
MQHYRLFRVDRFGRLLGCEQFDAPDDSAAEAVARDIKGRDFAELWDHGRKLKEFEAATNPMPAPAR